MNFKTLLSFTALALIGTVHAGPIKENTTNSDCQCKNRCQGYLMQFSEKAYTCLTPANFITLRGKHCVNVKGFYSDQTSLYCIDEENSNTNLCNKSSKEYNYDQCMRNMYFLGKEMNIEISIYNEDQVRTEILCKKNNGVYLETDDERYACLKEEANEKNNTCVVIDDHYYCVSETNEGLCQLGKKKYNIDGCIQFLYIAAGQSNFRIQKADKYVDNSKELCESKNGIYLSFSNEKHACLIEGSNENTEDKICVTVKKIEYETKTPDRKVYCIDESNTNNRNCILHSDMYNLNDCYKYVVSAGSSNSYSIKLIE